MRHFFILDEVKCRYVRRRRSLMTHDMWTHLAWFHDVTTSFTWHIVLGIWRLWIGNSYMEIWFGHLWFVLLTNFHQSELLVFVVRWDLSSALINLVLTYFIFSALVSVFQLSVVKVRQKQTKHKFKNKSFYKIFFFLYRWQSGINNISTNNYSQYFF